MSEIGNRFRVIVAGCGGSVFPCSENTDIYRSMEQCRGMPLQKGCRNGGCGRCKAQVLSGEYDLLPMSRAHVSEEEERNGIVLSCRVLPRSDMHIQPLYGVQKRHPQ